MIAEFYVGAKAIIEQDSKILLLQKSGERNFWDTPGGRINDTESVEQALRRELAEELLDISDVRVSSLLHVERIPDVIVDGKSLLLVWYHVQAKFLRGIELSEEHEAYKWCSLEEVSKFASVGIREATEAL